MSEPPKIVLPAWRRLPSGLIIPGSAIDRVRPPQAQVPPELQLAINPTAQSPDVTLLDHALVYADEDKLGLSESTLDEIIDGVSRLPFEPAFLAIARLQQVIWHVWDDGPGQLGVAGQLFPSSPILDNIAAWVSAGSNHTVFAEQHLSIVQRLLVDHAAHGPVSERMTQEQWELLLRTIFAATAITDPGLQSLKTGTASLAEFVGFTVVNAALNGRPNDLEAIARAQSLFVELAHKHIDPELPIEEWAKVDYEGFSLIEQYAIGFAVYAMSKALQPEAPIQDRSLISLRDFILSSVWGRRRELTRLIGASREWYADAFAQAAARRNDAASDLAYETTPFMQRPCLLLENGTQMVVVSRRAIATWLTDGFYFRLLESAQRRSSAKDQRSLRFKEYAGQLFEQHALTVVRSAYPGQRPPGGGRVLGEQVVGKQQLKTPDVVIDLGDLVVMEVRSGYLSREARVGNQKNLERDLEQLVFKKVRQLAARIDEILDKKVVLADIDVDHVPRVWPVVVTADLMETPHLHEWIRDATKHALDRPKVQPLMLLDMADLETLMGLVEAGHSLVDLLADKRSGAWREFELMSWLRDAPGAPKPSRSSVSIRHWEAAGEAAEQTLKLIPSGRFSRRHRSVYYLVRGRRWLERRFRSPGGWSRPQPPAPG